MATKAAALKKLREICSDLPAFSEGSHSGAIAFKSGKQMFASWRETATDAELVLALEPDHAATLLARDPRFSEYTRAPNCVRIHASDIDDWTEVRALLRESQALATRKKR
jgi:hypothetical protein